MVRDKGVQSSSASRVRDPWSDKLPVPELSVARQKELNSQDHGRKRLVSERIVKNCGLPMVKTEVFGEVASGTNINFHSYCSPRPRQCSAPMR